ncbi:MAG: hypothetical protein IKG69_04420 [Atopobiaceae bacterium]|nr:hypothetical protein [Atopobiaceae bacterium]
MATRESAKTARRTGAWLLAIVLACAAFTVAPALALAETGGNTELVVQGTTDGSAEEDAERRPDAQAHAVVASDGRGGGKTPGTGDATPLAPVALVTSGAGLVLAGRAVRRRRDATLPVIPRREATPGKTSARHRA